MDRIYTLYLIGNGFDLFHGIKSSYNDYKKWLQEYNYETYCNILDLFENSNLLDLWSDLESNLAKVDIIAHTLEIASSYYPDFGAEFRNRDYYTAQFEAETMFTNILSDIILSFGEWVRSLAIPQDANRIELEYDNSFFINFNYTTTIEELYHIKRDKILHIHGSIYSDDYILGHGQSYDQIDKANRFNDYLYEESGIDYIYEMVRDECISQIASLKKDTDGLILKYLDNRDYLNDISKIIVLGLSISEVDIPYIDFLIKTALHADWEISWFTKKDKTQITKHIVDRYGKERIIKLFEFKDRVLNNSQLRFNF